MCVVRGAPKKSQLASDPKVSWDRPNESQNKLVWAWDKLSKVWIGTNPINPKFVSSPKCRWDLGNTQS